MPETGLVPVIVGGAIPSFAVTLMLISLGGVVMNRVAADVVGPLQLGSQLDAIAAVVGHHVGRSGD
jgi:hypothetical protein